jgi:hypothetical protein
MSYADIDLEMVPAAPPTLKNQRATSCPAPISANAPSERVEVDLERFLVGAQSGTFVGNRSLDSVCHGPCTTFLTNYGGLLLRWTGRSFPSVLLLRRITKSQLAELLWFGCGVRLLKIGELLRQIIQQDLMLLKGQLTALPDCDFRFIVR